MQGARFAAGMRSRPPKGGVPGKPFEPSPQRGTASGKRVNIAIYRRVIITYNQKSGHSAARPPIPAVHARRNVAMSGGECLMKRKWLVFVLAGVLMLSWSTSALAKLQIVIPTPSPTKNPYSWITTPKPTLNWVLPAEEILCFYENPKTSETCARHQTKGQNLMVQVRMLNQSETQTIDAIDVAIYCTNAYGEPITPSDGQTGYVRVFSSDKVLKPGKNAYIGYFKMEGCKQAKSYYIAIIRYHVKGENTHQIATADALNLSSTCDWTGWDIE